ncbi:malate synthase A [bacterium]|nr:malate synthase A [bacterium]
MSIEVTVPIEGRREAVFSAGALEFVAGLHRRFAGTRTRLLADRDARQLRWDAGETPDFLPETAEVRRAEWQVAPPPGDLADRRVEITGPVERKMMINALNSGARVFMADFEDANSPTWDNVADGQVNLYDAVRGTIELITEDREYRLGDVTATLMVRPRGWHLTEKHVLIDGQQVSASLIDFGIHMYNNAAELLERGSGPYFYLPKLESHLEARLWNDVFVAAQEELGIPVGSVRATVLIETVLAAFEMEEILYELRDHSAGLNAGRWDYIFSVIKKFRRRPDFVLPDRRDVTMTVPFMRAYTEQLVRACHRRGAHAMGGMAAFIPNRNKPDVTARALAAVRADKEREVADGCDGTWVAHPDLVPTAIDVFDSVLGDRPNQIDRLREDVVPSAADLLDVRVPGGIVTDRGLRKNVEIGIRYLASWLAGNGAAALNDLMEDAATAEISRTQVWQWAHHGVSIDGGPKITPDLVQGITAEVLEAFRADLGEEVFAAYRFEEAARLFEQVALAEHFEEFLTIPAYELI